MLTQVEMQLVAQGTVEDFDQAGFQASLGAYLGVSPAGISLDVSAASVNVKVTITFADASAARSVVDTMQGLTSNLAALSAAVGVTVEGATGPVVSQVVVLAPSPPPPSPPPPPPWPPVLSPPPPSPSPPPPSSLPLLPPSPPPAPLEKLIDSEELVETGEAIETGEATMSTGVIVGVVVAMLFLVAVLAVIMLLEYRRQRRRAASGQTTSGWTFDPKAAQVGEAANPPQLEGNPATAAVPSPTQARLAVRRI